jgi:ribosomal protein S25
MENKRLGVLILIFSIAFLVFANYFNTILYDQSEKLDCIVNNECIEIEKSISLTNIAFGFFGFMFGLGVYILFFNKSEERILRRLEDEKDHKIGEEKFNIILMALDPHEKKVMKAIKDHDGITQSTLRLRTDMSKTKLSYVLQELEKRNLIKRVKKGKTLEVFLKI